jgi:hypothetical protein
MTTYDLAFARKFADVAEATISQPNADVECQRVVAYISRVSMELSLKAFLEQAGFSIDEIKKHWHNLRTLLDEVGKCEVEIEIAGVRKWVPAVRVQAVDVGFQGHVATLGVILRAEDHGASQYPNELRYGVTPKDFPAEALAKAATALAKWVEKHIAVVRKP